MKEYIKKIIILVNMCMALIGTFACYAGEYSFQGEVLTGNGHTYYLNVNGGVKSYIAYQASTNVNNKNTLGAAFLSSSLLPDAQKTESSKALTAALRYSGYNNSFGLGANAQYLVKIAATDGTIRYGTWTNKSLWNIGENNYVNFRYAGIGLTSKDMSSSSDKISGIAVTNPNFVSDWVQQSNNGGQQQSAVIYTTDGKTTSRDVWGTGGDIYDLSFFYANGRGQLTGVNGKTNAYSGSGIVRTNAASALNFEAKIASKTFEEWKKQTEYGEAYWNYAEEYIKRKGLNLQPWEVLNNLFQISGNVNDEKQSVLLYCVCTDGSSTWYRTYSIPGQVTNNVASTFLGIKDENGIKVGETSRSTDDVDPYNGLEAALTTASSEPVKLQRNKRYTVDAMLSYFVNDVVAKDQTANTQRTATLGVIPTGNTTALIYGASLSTAASIDASAYSSVEHNGDGKLGGAIKTQIGVSSGYHFANAAFTTPEFYITNDMPDSGYIVVTVPDSYAVAGDNEVLYDDQLMIKYTVTDDGDTPTPNNTEAYGDMNMGQREWRSYHYISEEEVDDTDNPIVDEETGEETGEYEQKTVLVEHYSDYGCYESASQGEAACQYTIEDVSGPATPDGKSIYKVSDTSWWEYTDRVWPDQGEDALWKCWVAKGSSNTYDDSNQYTRGQYVNFPFSLGFAISRSKGETGTTVDTPTLDVKIYGVSPDTGDSGELIKEAQVKSASLGVYEQKTAYLENLAIGLAAGNQEYPRMRVEAKIDDSHGESNLYGGLAAKAPYNNAWETEHDSYDWTIEAEMEDMRIMEVELKDSEGVVIYHADRYNTSYMDEIVDGYFDREEDLTLKVVIEQKDYIGHDVVDPTIDVRVTGLTESGNEINTYVNSVLTNYTTLGENVQTTYEGIFFRPQNAEKIAVSVAIDDKHSADEWRENIWDDDEDSFYKVISCTTADLALTQDIELYNSNGNPQDYLTFGEYLDFKYNVRHIGSNDRQRAVVGGSTINPYVKVNTKIYNADELTYMSPTSSTLKYRMVAGDDPKRNTAFIRGDQIQTTSRLYPGLGTNGYASHVQAWLNDYVVQSRVTKSGNVAAYGHILVTGLIDETHDYSHFNIRDNTVDYVQKEFKGEKNFKIVDMAVTNRNSITSKNPLKDKSDTAVNPGLAVQVAVQNTASSYNDQTVIDRTYLDIYIDDVRKTTAVIDVPVGQTVVTELTINDVDLTGCKTVEARVNTGAHQTHYEYVLKETDSTLFDDPFSDNYMTTIVCPNLPSTTICPTCIIDEDDQLIVDPVFNGGTTVTPPVVNDTTDKSKYTVLYNSNDDSGESRTQSISYNSTVMLDANPFTRPGYVFKSWNTDKNGKGTAYANTAVVTIGERQTYYGATKLTLYAQWEPVTYKIEFNGNGADSGSMDAVSATYEQSITLPENTFKKYGYIFSCWSDKADGSGNIYTDKDYVKNLSTSETPAVLYAQWYPAAGAFLKEYGYDENSFKSLSANAIIAYKVQLMNLLKGETYGYVQMKIPTFEADNGARYDIFNPNIDTAKFTLISSTKGTDSSTSSVYVYRYNTPLTSIGTNGSVTSDFLTSLQVHGSYVKGNAIGGSFELDGVVLYTTGGNVTTLDKQAIVALKNLQN